MHQFMLHINNRALCKKIRTCLKELIVGLQKERRKGARDDSAEEKLAARLVGKNEALRRYSEADNKED